MVKFRQTIRPGEIGADILAVKRAMRRMGIKGSGSMALTRRAGPAFVTVLKRTQRQHNVPADGIYGPKTHAVIAPHFSIADSVLYRSARIRKPPTPPVPPGGTAALAQKLLQFHAQGKYRADNPGDLRDLQATAAGRAIWSQGGYYTHLDIRVLQLLVWLIENGFRVGTFALCSDHHNDGPHGHAGGRAVDISSIDSISIASGGSRSVTLKMDEALRQHVPATLRPRQLITGGYGYRRDWTISSYSIPAADSYYGSSTMAQHCNHIHVGY